MLYCIFLSFVIILLPFSVICVQTETFPIFRDFSLSNKDCIKACDERPKCLVSKYLRRFLLCELFVETDVITTQRGAWFREKDWSTIYLWNINHWACIGCLSNEVCQEKEDSVYKCLPSSCMKPDEMAGTTIMGNMNSFGSRLKYECEHGLISNNINKVLYFRVVTCLTNGSWTWHQFSCSCVTPKVLHGTVSIIKHLSGLNQANISCLTGYELRQRKAPTCDPKFPIWEDLEDVYCDKMVEGPWRKIYSFPDNADQNIGVFKHWTEPNMTGYTKHFYRNDNFVDNWSKQEIENLKLSVLANDIEVATIIFNGTDSTRVGWFTKERLLYSTWEDLSNSSEISYMSWRGIMKYHKTNESVTLRHYINKVYNETNCEANYGWFVVTWVYFPCNNPLPTMPVILYSKTKNASRFVKGEIGVADRFEVWVN